MKKKIIISVIVLIVLCSLGIGAYKLYNYIRIKNAKIEVTLVDNLKVEFNSDPVKFSTFIKSINGRINNDHNINTRKLGKQDILVKFTNNEGIDVKYNFSIEIVDTVQPVVWIGNTYTVTVNSSEKFIDKIFCGDNYDNNPVCTIEGYFDLTKTGSYPVSFTATDNSGNKTKKDFTLRVIEPSNNSSSNNYNQNVTHTYYSDVIKNYKKDDTKIGIDVSEWQGEIDFDKIKEAGVEFMFIRVGGEKGTGKDYFVDKQFERNIKLANEYNIPVGIYFYSYADNSKEAIENAKWVINKIKPYKVDLPVVFDWEDFSDFNSYNLSFFGLTSMAEDFLKTIEDAGYKGMLYGSKNYLEKIWLKTKYETWLAHYTYNTNYEGDYKVWQMCNDGVINGINGAVDIDIMY